LQGGLGAVGAPVSTWPESQRSSGGLKVAEEGSIDVVHEPTYCTDPAI
jgi:hypothetical protein